MYAHKLRARYVNSRNCHLHILYYSHKLSTHMQIHNTSPLYVVAIRLTSQANVYVILYLNSTI